VVVAEASIPGLFRTILIIIGVIVLLRFLGQLMMAKRNMEEERRLNAQQRKSEKDRAEKLCDFGKTSILNSKGSSSGKSGHSDIQDVDYEELP
jgi:hypothetical protein